MPRSKFAQESEISIHLELKKESKMKKIERYSVLIDVKMIILYYQKQVYRFSVVLSKITIGFFTEIEKKKKSKIFVETQNTPNS